MIIGVTEHDHTDNGMAKERIFSGGASYEQTALFIDRP